MIVQQDGRIRIIEIERRFSRLNGVQVLSGMSRDRSLAQWVQQANNKLLVRQEIYLERAEAKMFLDILSSRPEFREGLFTWEYENESILYPLRKARA